MAAADSNDTREEEEGSIRSRPCPGVYRRSKAVIVRYCAALSHRGGGPVWAEACGEVGSG